MPKLRKITADEFDNTPEDDSDSPDNGNGSDFTPTEGERYPYLATWVREYGSVAFGQEHSSPSMVRIFDDDGMVWESETYYPTLDEALEAANGALEDLAERGEI
ncbi:MAG TPA: hypothetical protein VFS21_04990 [Roseiflexaceae bacterium]|nr:hypothetical protein [Roseiflexaceae bacterium]